jgi:hypothetical protein
MAATASSWLRRCSGCRGTPRGKPVSWGARNRGTLPRTAYRLPLCVPSRTFHSS